MSVAAAPGYPQFANANIAYIPQLYAAETLVKYYAKSVVPAIANTKYEGTISDKGDKVIIRTRPDITIRNYTKGQELNFETPSSAPTELLIDQGKYYAFTIDDVDEKQADIVLDSEFTDDSAEQMRIAIDTDVLGTQYAFAHASNKGSTAGAISGDINLGVSGSPLAVTKTNVIEVIESLVLVWDEQNVPESGRNLVIPAWFRFLVMNSDLKNASITGDQPSITRNGRVGEIDMVTLYMSNLLSSATDGSVKAFNAMATQTDALTFAAQLVKNETVRAEKSFGWRYKGLTVYGRKTVKPEGMIHLYIYKSTS